MVLRDWCITRSQAVVSCSLFRGVPWLNWSQQWWLATLSSLYCYPSCSTISSIKLYFVVVHYFIHNWIASYSGRRSIWTLNISSPNRSSVVRLVSFISNELSIVLDSFIWTNNSYNSVPGTALYGTSNFCYGFYVCVGINLVEPVNGLFACCNTGGRSKVSIKRILNTSDKGSVSF